MICYVFGFRSEMMKYTNANRNAVFIRAPFGEVLHDNQSLACIGLSRHLRALFFCASCAMIVYIFLDLRLFNRS